MSKELRACIGVTGLTLVARVYDPVQSTTAKIGSDITMTEIGTTAVYYGDMAGAAGNYSVDFLVAATGVKYASGWIAWDGTAEILVAGVPAAVWAYVVEGTHTAVQYMRGMASALMGKLSGAPTAPVFRDVDDTKNRITATTDANGNRSAVTTTLT